MEPDRDTAELIEELEQEQQTLPFSGAELRRLFVAPQRALELFVSERRRLAVTIASGNRLGLVLLGLLLVSAVFVVPFAAVPGLDRIWRVPALFLGSLAICFPALHIIGAYFGSRCSVYQNLCLSLIITAVAALFTVAFAPILWFFHATMAAGAMVTTGQLFVVFLAVALLAGIVHLGRVLLADRAMRRLGVASLLSLYLWQHLLAFITYRMARVLDII
jgi:hypothetical protein